MMVNVDMSCQYSDVEKSIIKLVESIYNDSHKLKAAMVLSFTASECMKTLKKIDTRDFYKETLDLIDTISKSKEAFLVPYLEHLEQNRLVVESLGQKADAVRELMLETERTEAEYRRLKDEYDKKLAEIIEQRDKLQISNL